MNKASAVSGQNNVPSLYPLKCGTYDMGANVKPSLSKDGRLQYVVVLESESLSKTRLVLDTTSDLERLPRSETWINAKIQIFKRNNSYDLDGKIIGEVGEIPYQLSRHLVEHIILRQEAKCAK